MSIFFAVLQIFKKSEKKFTSALKPWKDFLSVTVNTNTNTLCGSVWILQAAIQMSPCMTSHFCLLLLPVMSLLLLFSPIGWSYDGLTPGCHLHREEHTQLLKMLFQCLEERQKSFPLFISAHHNRFDTFSPLSSLQRDHPQ